MGTIAHFDLAGLAREFDTSWFVETGTGDGQSLSFAAHVYPQFRQLWSCEIESKLATRAQVLFGHDIRIRIFNQQSCDFIRHVCVPGIDKSRIFFWLDAHFPGADYGLHGYGDEANLRIRLPLTEELLLIRTLRQGHDIIAVDDARIYLDGPFQHGNLPDVVRPFCPKERSVDFVYHFFRDTHDIAIHYEHEGYLLLTPKRIA